MAKTRKLVIDNITYLFHVTKTHTKIRGFLPVKNIDIGHKIIDTCSCYMGPGTENATCWYSEKIAVGPGDVKKYILSCRAA